MSKASKNNDAAATPIKRILATVLHQCRRDLKLDPDLWGQIWNRAVDADIARNAQPAAFKQRLLIVHVTSSVWLQELHFQKSALIERVNREAGHRVLDDIQFKVGPLAEP